MRQEIDLPNEAATQACASRVAKKLSPGMILTFSGDLGSGKTSFIRAMLRALGVTGAIKSPSFSLIESYSCKAFQFHHFDLYRIHEEEELEYIGFRDYFLSDSVCCIEWPERAKNSIDKVDIRFTLSVKGKGRLLLVEPLGRLAQEKLKEPWYP